MIGKSGVGKSNLFVAMQKEHQQTHSEQLTFLIYDGANLLSNGLSITETITRDINDRLINNQKPSVENDVWQNIARIIYNSNHQVVLVIDAINENPQAKALLVQINELVQRPLSWLKVIFSSRPETWQTIKRGVRLEEADFYRGNEDGSIGFELEQFTYSDRLDIFSDQELPLVYEKYRAHFGIETPFDGLQGDIKQMLCDPLNLRLLADLHRNLPIPNTTKVSGLIARYIKNLVDTQRLSKDDQVFLATRMLPIMIRPHHYTNSVSVSDVEDVDQELLNDIFLITNAQQTSSTAQSLARLIDTEILVRQGSGYDERIAFKYERFYEFFAGGVLFDMLGTQTSWHEQYIEWLNVLPQAPFLWGAIRMCLELQLRNLSSDQSIGLLIQLSRIPSVRIIEIVQAALTEYGQENREKTEEIVYGLLRTDRSRLRAIIHPEIKSAQCPAWKRIGLQVATNLKMERQIEFALADYSAAVRAVAIRCAFVVWHRDSSVGFQILANIVKNLSILNLQTMEAGIGLSLLILFETFRDPNSVSVLRQIWHRKIETLFLINPNKLFGRSERWKRAVLSALLNVGVQFILRVGNDDPPPNAHITVPELEHFFKRDENSNARREIVRIIAPYIRIDNDLREIEDVLIRIADERDMLITLLLLTIFQRHMTVSPETTIPIARKLYIQATTTYRSPGPGPMGLLVAATCVVGEAGFDKGRSEHVLWAVTDYLDRFQGKWWTDLEMRRWSQLDSISQAENRVVEDRPISSLAQKYVRQILASNDYSWMINAIEWDVRARAVEAGFLRFAFTILEFFIQVEETSVRESVIKVLAQIRVYHPDAVDDFIEINGVDDDFKAGVRTQISSENLGDLIGLRFIIFWAEAMIINGSPEAWQKIIWLFDQASESRTLATWIVKWFKVIINEIYGGPVFTDAPRQKQNNADQI